MSRLAWMPPSFSRTLTADSTSSSCSGLSPLLPRPYVVAKVPWYSPCTEWKGSAVDVAVSHLDAHDGFKKCFPGLLGGCPLYMVRVGTLLSTTV